ncbi:MAG: hypothetical protein EOM50_13935 [Erysipelotrichia bacterium]|nr:hypothetical protein [Erysipelotrichia bacterium]
MNDTIITLKVNYKNVKNKELVLDVNYDNFEDIAKKINNAFKTLLPIMEAENEKIENETSQNDNAVIENQ